MALKLLSCIIWFVLMILMIVTSDGAAIPQSTEDNESIHKLDPIGSAIFYVAGIITSFANMTGSSLMIYLTIRHKSEPLTPSKRFPLYMAIMDFGTSITIFPNLFYPMEKDYLMGGSLCTSLGFMTSLFIVMNMMLMASLALITYLRICKRCVINLGKNDWILFISILFPTLTISLVTWILDGFGPDTLWCFMNQEESGSRVNLIALIIFSYIVAIITSFCYMSVIKRIHNVESMLTSASSANNSNEDVQDFKSKTFSFRKSSLKVFPDKLSSSSSESLKDDRVSMSIISSTSLDGLEIRPPSFFYGPLIAPTAAQERTLENISKATRKMSSYIFLQLIQYTPIIIYSLCFLMNQMQTWVYILTIVMLNLGGVAKSLTFMKNEVWFECKKEQKTVRTLCKYKVPLNEKYFECDEEISYNKQKENSISKNNGNIPFISMTVQQGFFVEFTNDDNLKNTAGQDQ